MSERNALARVVDSTPFTVAVVATIAVNAVVLGLQTYEGLEPRWGTALDRLNAACLAVFVVELLVRLASYWPRPWRFFRSGWNVFDFVVVGAAFVPGIQQNSTLLRLVRLLRVIRIVRVLPDLRVLLLGIWRSIPPLASIGAVTVMILFVYGMLGWILFADELPAQWGNVGRAMLTLFVMLTLENFPVYMDAAMDVEPWAWVYFVSFILVAAFIVLNVLIGIVLNSMEEARELDRRKALRERYGVDQASPIVPRRTRTWRSASRSSAPRSTSSSWSSRSVPATTNGGRRPRAGRLTGGDGARREPPLQADGSYGERSFGMAVSLGVALGGALGALSRYGVDSLVERRSDGAFPWATFVVNTSGCLAVGFLVAAFVDRHRAPYWLRAALVLGFCGGYTTFSTFAEETLDLVEGRAVAVALASTVGSVTLGVLAVLVGTRLGRLV